MSALRFSSKSLNLCETWRKSFILQRGEGREGGGEGGEGGGGEERGVEGGRM